MTCFLKWSECRRFVRTKCPMTRQGVIVVKILIGKKNCNKCNNHVLGMETCDLAYYLLYHISSSIYNIEIIIRKYGYVKCGRNILFSRMVSYVRFKNTGCRGFSDNAEYYCHYSGKSRIYKCQIG